MPSKCHSRPTPSRGQAAGIHFTLSTCHSRECGNPFMRAKRWMPACAGMTIVALGVGHGRYWTNQLSFYLSSRTSPPFPLCHSRPTLSRGQAAGIHLISTILDACLRRHDRCCFRSLSSTLFVDEASKIIGFTMCHTRSTPTRRQAAGIHFTLSTCHSRECGNPLW
jgi:hypothetical protein